MDNLKFREIKITDKNLFNKYLSRSSFMGSEYSFPSLFIWRYRYGYKIAEFNGHLIVSVTDKLNNYFFYPVGDGNLKETIEAIFNYSQKVGWKCRIAAITKENIGTLEQVFPNKFRFISKREFSDYIYDSASLINLSGQKYKSKRNHINRFIQEYGEVSYEDITPNNIDECKEGYNQWLENKKDKGEEIDSFSDEIIAMKECFNHYQDIGLIGGLIRARGNLCSFTFGSKINNETFGINVEKSLIECQGGYAVINKEFARRHASEYKYINREEDMGIKGLRQSKLSYHPLFLLEKFTAIHKGILL